MKGLFLRWCFLYELIMCGTRGHSSGINKLAKWMALAWQHSDCILISSVLAGYSVHLRFYWYLKRSSVPKQKRHTTISTIFSSISSLLSSCLILSVISSTEGVTHLPYYLKEGVLPFLVLILEYGELSVILSSEDCILNFLDSSNFSSSSISIG